MLDCLVIGGGQSGLMCGHLLARAGANYLVIDASARAGDVWRNRPRNLRLFTSRQFCRLADLSMLNDPNGFPSGEEFADHVERFYINKAINVSFSTRIVRLFRSGNGFIAELENGSILNSKTVINATGSNQVPTYPVFAKKIASTVRQIVASEFGDADQFPDGWNVGVIGDGASGRQIALELADRHRVYLAQGRVRKHVPNIVFGRDVFWWLDKIGLLFAERDSVVAKIIRKRDPIPVASANNQQLALRGVKLKPRAVDIQDDHIYFSDGSHERVDAVVWCVGYQENTDWIDLPSIEREKYLSEHYGKTSENGFFVIGRKWLTCRASELILGCERDANMVVDLVLKNIQEK
ncbi:flavin-containing monooxygenase [Deefgea rivuli]|uniref:flavin-containing monooxygenase n=1 Tax=Deefgea rivuli TaxID=400948 RepID=UPI00048052FE|nr:NAD(P)/FAD-dependent oxidoreductase [Deefgea rivuli]